MRLILIVLISIFSISEVFSQNIVFSTPQKLSGKTPKFRILGKSNEGILLYNFGKDANIIQSFSSNMKLKWKHSIHLKVPEAYIRKIIIYPDKSIIFYYTQDKYVTKYYAEILDARFQNTAVPILLDSLHGDKYELTDMKVIHSQDKSKLMVYAALYENGVSLKRIISITCDDDLNNIKKHTQDFSIFKGENVLRKVVLANNGLAFYLIENTEKRGRNEPKLKDNFKLFDGTNGEIKELTFVFDKTVFDKLFIEIDNVNNNLIATSLYSEDDEEMSKGFFVQILDVDSNKIIVNSIIPYDEDLLYDITGKELKPEQQGLYSFEITDIIVKYDGGVIIVTESRYKSVEEIQTPSFVPAAGPSYRTIDITYYNDLVIHSVLPDGKSDWAQIIRKKQVSEDDGGYYSSYALFNISNQLHFIYNEEIHPKADVDDSVLFPNGETNRSYLFNTGDQNVLLVPRVGKQVSENELVIPSFRKNFLTLLKISY